MRSAVEHGGGCGGGGGGGGGGGDDGASDGGVKHKQGGDEGNQDGTVTSTPMEALLLAQHFQSQGLDLQKTAATVNHISQVFSTLASMVEEQARKFWCLPRCIIVTP